MDFGLFFFAFANAGVAFSQINSLTWIVLLSLLVGKTFGIALCGWLADRAGFSLPSGMTHRHTVLVGIIAGIGLTVALFVSGQAFTAPARFCSGQDGSCILRCRRATGPARCRCDGDRSPRVPFPFRQPDPITRLSKFEFPRSRSLTMHYDLVVIGSGPAGQKGAISAAKLGQASGPD